VTWRSEAACKAESRDIFFPEGTGNWQSAYKEAEAICAGCPVKDECLRECMESERGQAQMGLGTNGNVYGYYGGTTPSQRRKLHEKWRAEHKAA
jgi:WhiB family redox-sensing transcriptional regulator